ncbi:unnamed protein product [Lactuca virosa]|uniref:Uncharacterized protein n=1 Tax=Lactuca virosa TaxID=75947 RepID=A0AAU9M1W4_9ASTR|nr:unnamed protein product [Lactuca virosa]
MAVAYASVRSINQLLGCSFESFILQEVTMPFHRQLSLGIDINVAWDDVIDETQIVGEETDAEIKNFKNHFDLNSSVTEDNEMLVTVTTDRRGFLNGFQEEMNSQMEV